MLPGAAAPRTGVREEEQLHQRGAPGLRRPPAVAHGDSRAAPRPAARAQRRRRAWIKAQGDTASALALAASALASALALASAFSLRMVLRTELLARTAQTKVGAFRIALVSYLRHSAVHLKHRGRSTGSLEVKVDMSTFISSTQSIIAHKHGYRCLQTRYHS